VLKPRHYENAPRSGGIGPHILQLDIGYLSVANFTRQPLHLLVNIPRYQWIGGQICSRTCLDAVERRNAGNHSESLNHPARKLITVLTELSRLLEAPCQYCHVDMSDYSRGLDW
jgi:hypothetical protein